MEASNLPTFSIIIPSARPVSIWLRCLQSIGRASLPSIAEVILVRNGSSASGHYTIDEKEYSFPIDIQSIPTVGPSAARNYGARLASGSHLIFLDDDCTLPETFFVKLSQYISKFPTLKVLEPVAVCSKKSNKYGRVWESMIRYHFESASTIPGSTARSVRLLGNCYCIERSVFNRVGEFDESLRTREDLDYVLRLKKQGLSVAMFREINVFHSSRSSFLQTASQFFRYAKGQKVLEQKWHPNELHEDFDYKNAVQFIKKTSGLSRVSLYSVLMAQAMGKALGNVEYTGFRSTLKSSWAGIRRAFYFVRWCIDG